MAGASYISQVNSKHIIVLLTVIGWPTAQFSSTAMVYTVTHTTITLLQTCKIHPCRASVGLPGQQRAVLHHDKKQTPSTNASELKDGH